MAEYFDYESVKSDLSQMEMLFDKFAEHVRTVNDVLVENMTQNANAAVYGDYGKKLLELWDNNSSTFGDFKANFEEWSKLVTLVGINNEKFEDYVTGAVNQMSNEAFENSNYGKFVKSNYGYTGNNYGSGSNPTDTNSTADDLNVTRSTGVSAIDEKDFSGTLFTHENSSGANDYYDVSKMMYTNENGDIVTQYRDKNGNDLGYISGGNYYDKNGKKISESEFFNGMSSCQVAGQGTTGETKTCSLIPSNGNYITEAGYNIKSDSLVQKSYYDSATGDVVWSYADSNNKIVAYESGDSNSVITYYDAYGQIITADRFNEIINKYK